MKPLLIYDGSCPACRVYTKGFVSMGLLSPEERQAHDACAFPQVMASLDTERARHEIPLVDLEGAEVRYGIDALLTEIHFCMVGPKRSMRSSPTTAGSLSPPNPNAGNCWTLPPDSICVTG
jgi:hypothetical protein